MNKFLYSSLFLSSFVKSNVIKFLYQSVYKIDVFNSGEMDYICSLLKMNTKLSDEIKGEHLNYIKKVAAKKN